MNLLDGLRSRNRASQCDQRITFAIRRQQSCSQVAHSGTRGGNRDAGLTGQPADAAGNECRILFVAADHSLNRGRNQRVEHLVDLSAGNSEDVSDPVPFQRLHHYLSAGF